EPRELTRVPVRLVRVVDENPDQLEVGMLHDASERELADIARAPLCDSVRHGRISLAGGVALQDRGEGLPGGSLPGGPALPFQRSRRPCWRARTARERRPSTSARNPRSP